MGPLPRRPIREAPGKPVDAFSAPGRLAGPENAPTPARRGLAGHRRWRIGGGGSMAKKATHTPQTTAGPPGEHFRPFRMHVSKIWL
jgi:hypothetical protein